jgi:hypothetical protein
MTEYRLTYTGERGRDILISGDEAAYLDDCGLIEQISATNEWVVYWPAGKALEVNHPIDYIQGYIAAWHFWKNEKTSQ